MNPVEPVNLPIGSAIIKALEEISRRGETLLSVDASTGATVQEIHTMGRKPSAEVFALRQYRIVIRTAVKGTEADGLGAERAVIERDYRVVDGGRLIETRRSMTLPDGFRIP